MPDRARSKSDRASDDAADRAADHAAIDRLSDELLPALIAKLGATGLGELEVREGTWRVRLRRPATAGGGSRDRRAGDRTSVERSSERSAERPPRSHHHHAEPATSLRTDPRNVATSPAVGVYQPRKDLTAGAKVRAGDRLGAVDMLGIAQEVVSPVDGIVGASLVEAGDAVEYGQELIVIEFTPVPSSTNGTGA
ncbi:MAG TPA: biotin/lipoyl-containing protein [Candidatus Limnocylindrales bacterium]|nr:biotin/lipoyl-containing protein [Candidatus Limnocylindrales bacterium]